MTVPRVDTVPGRTQRELWNGTPTKGGDLFTLTKRQHNAVCELWSHQFGWEIKLLVNGEMRQTQVCSSIQDWADVRDDWQAKLIENGWT